LEEINRRGESREQGSPKVEGEGGGEPPVLKDTSYRILKDRNLVLKHVEIMHVETPRLKQLGGVVF
jgi:hypothetical protein